LNQVPSELNTAFYERVLDSLQDGVYYVDRDRKILYWNKGAELLTGFAANEVVGQSCRDNLLMHLSDEGCALCSDGCLLERTIEDGQRRECETYIRHKFGYRIPVSVRVAAISDPLGNIIGAVEIFSDASAKKHIERRVGELENLVFLDSLTGVSNRRYMELKVRQAIQEVEQFHRKIGLLMLDLDHFKAVNDEYGHSVGDEVLKALCATLANNLRSGDLLGRWGGEEFLILAADVNASRLRAFAERCRMLASESAIPVSGGALRVTLSIGATLIRSDDSLQSVVQRADELMYRSKAEGRNRIATG